MFPNGQTLCGLKAAPVRKRSRQRREGESAKLPRLSGGGEGTCHRRRLMAERSHQCRMLLRWWQQHRRLRERG